MKCPFSLETDEYTTLITQCKEGAQCECLMLDSPEELHKWIRSASDKERTRGSRFVRIDLEGQGWLSADHFPPAFHALTRTCATQPSRGFRHHHICKCIALLSLSLPVIVSFQINEPTVDQIQCFCT